MPPKAKRQSAAARSRTPRGGAAAEAGQGRVIGLKALLLGLERRPDRRQRCEEMLAKEVPWLSVDFFRASDGKVDDIPAAHVAETWNTKHNSNYGAYEDVFDKETGKLLYSQKEFEDPGVDYKFSPGERGCAHSHYRMWQRVAETYGPTLILEDDVQLIFDRTGGGQSSGRTFTRRLELGMAEASKMEADVLYLGWSGHRDGNYRHHTQQRGRKNPIVRKAEYVWTTVAYVLWPRGAKKLLSRAKPMDQPVDNFMAWECREGRLNALVLLDDGDTDDTWSGGIVTQLDFTGDSDIKKSDGGDQDDDPTLYLAKRVARLEEALQEAPQPPVDAD